jgi:hypothetical protein
MSVFGTLDAARMIQVRPDRCCVGTMALRFIQGVDLPQIEIQDQIYDHFFRQNLPAGLYPRGQYLSDLGYALGCDNLTAGLGHLGGLLAACRTLLQALRSSQNRPIVHRIGNVSQRCLTGRNALLE